MAGFFKSMFGKGVGAAKQETTPSPEQIAGMPLDELVTFKPETMSFGVTTAVLRRLHQIALFDNHVPEEQRALAGKLAETLAADLERSLSNDPEGLAALKSAISQTLELSRQGGYGSLIWRLNEYPMSAAETIPYIMKPEHRHLVPDFLEAIGPESVASMKHHMVRQLVVQADYNSRNSVLILHGLVAKGDKAAAAFFTSEEYGALLSVPSNYIGGRDVLVELGILSPSSDVTPFPSTSEIKAVLESIHAVLIKMHERAEADTRVIGLREERKHALLLTLAFLRVELTIELLCQPYGEETVYDVVTILSDAAVIEEFGRFRKVIQTLKTVAPGTAVDFALLLAVMGSIGPDSEAEFKKGAAFFNMAAEWVNYERVEFLDRLRSHLRAMCGDANVQEDWLELGG